MAAYHLDRLTDDGLLGPFHRLRDQDQATTCELDLALVEGMIQGSGSDVTAVLAPEQGYCCVRIRPAVPSPF